MHPRVLDVAPQGAELAGDSGRRGFLSQGTGGRDTDSGGAPGRAWAGAHLPFGGHFLRVYLRGVVCGSLGTRAAAMRFLCSEEGGDEGLRVEQRMLC